jgi:hypothetical protein
MTRDQRRSLWIAYAVAGRIVNDPEHVLNVARDRLAHLEGRANRWTREWDRLLGGDLEFVLQALTSTSQRSRELRQNSPFAGVLSAAERERVLNAFNRERHHDAAG